MIFGNWRPGGILTGSLMFGYTDSLRLRSAERGARAAAPGRDRPHRAARSGGSKGQRTQSIGVRRRSACCSCVWFLTTDAVPREFTGMTPYIATLLVLAFASQRLRMPKADGQIYRKGSAG